MNGDNINLDITEENYKNLEAKALEHYKNFTKAWYVIEDGNIVHKEGRKKIKTVHGVEHCKAVIELADKISQIVRIPKNEQPFVKLLAGYHDSSRLHEREDKEEMPNGQIFYNETKGILSEEARLLGGLLISLKGELGKMLKKNPGNAKIIIKEFLEGKEEKLNNIEITRKVSERSVDEWYNLIEKKYLNHLVALNISDTLEVVRVRLAKAEDSKFTPEELEEHGVKINEQMGELILDLIQNKVPKEYEDQITELAISHFNKVVKEEKRYFPHFRDWELALKDLQQALNQYIENKIPETKKELNKNFLEEMTGESFTELRPIFANLLDIKPNEKGLEVLNKAVEMLSQKGDPDSEELSHALENWKEALKKKKVEEEEFIQRGR